VKSGRSQKDKDVLALIESKMSPASIRRSDEKARKMLLVLRLAEFRRAMKVDQRSVAGFSQPAVSKIESRGDIKLSTLIEYCHGLGAEVEISARSPRQPRKRFVLLKSA
jgi:hypothetical protein